jgi:ribosomal-protein-alanine N-acetyltransferase
MIVTRLIDLDDAAALADVLRANREFMTPWEPVRTEEYFTVAGQRAEIEGALGRYEAGTGLPHVILDREEDGAGEVVGRITLNGIVRGPFQSCSVGYWVGAAHNGRGVATAAVAGIKRVAFQELGLHRIQAETLPHNTGSQRVLARNGFVRIGMAPAYLHIAGRWQDHILFQALNEAYASPPQPHPGSTR